ncbi:hypothetical protein ABE236_26245 [Priestia endophytica]|uniref:hypothetical protein n=1 Tax=Priestia endophytica TaxID=135735 RepID=UPI003D26F40D
MVKKEVIHGILIAIIIVIVAYFLNEWKYVYYVCGGSGLIHLFLSLAYYLDGVILGDRKSITNKEKKMNIDRIHEARRFFSMSIPNLIAAFIYILVK